MGLLEDVKNYLDITWQDEATDKKIQGMIDRGKSYIDRITGEPMDYEQEESPRALLLDYVRYARSNALDEFVTNYLSMLMELQLDRRAREAPNDSEKATG